MQPKAQPESQCGRIVRAMLTQLGAKWTFLVVLGLSGGPLHRMLTVTLRTLERDGLVRRTVYPEVPPRTEYELTPLGVSFTEPVMAIANWAVDAQPEIEVHRKRFDGVRDS